MKTGFSAFSRYQYTASVNLNAQNAPAGFDNLFVLRELRAGFRILNTILSVLLTPVFSTGYNASSNLKRV